MEIKVGQPAERGRYGPGEILVKFREGTDEGTIARIQQEAHLETIRVVSSPILYLMEIVDGSPPPQARLAPSSPDPRPSSF